MTYPPQPPSSPQHGRPYGAPDPRGPQQGPPGYQQPSSQPPPYGYPQQPGYPPQQGGYPPAGYQQPGSSEVTQVMPANFYGQSDPYAGASPYAAPAGYAPVGAGSGRGATVTKTGGAILAAAGLLVAALSLLVQSTDFPDRTENTLKMSLGVFGSHVVSALEIQSLDQDILYFGSAGFGVLALLSGILAAAKPAAGRVFAIVFGIIGSLNYVFAVIYQLTSEIFAGTPASYLLYPALAAVLFVAGTITLMLPANSRR